MRKGTMEMKLLKTIRFSFLCIITGALFLVDTSNIFADTQNSTTTTTVTTFHCGKRLAEVCYFMVNPDGSKAISPGGADSVTTSTTTTTTGLVHLGSATLNVSAINSLPTATLFLFSTDGVMYKSNGEADKIGIGLIDAPYYYSEVDNKTYYIMNNVIVINSYSKWTSAVNHINDFDNYVGAKALVYPNPASEKAFVKLHEHYIDAYEVQSVECLLYDTDGTLLGTFHSSNTGGIVEIPCENLGSNSYFIQCRVKSSNRDIKDDIIPLQFIIAK